MTDSGHSSIPHYVENYVAQAEHKNNDKTTNMVYSMIQEAQFRFELKISEQVHSCRQKVDFCDKQLSQLSDLKSDIRDLQENLESRAKKEDFDAWVLTMPSYAKVLALRETKEQIQDQLRHLHDKFASFERTFDKVKNDSNHTSKLLSKCEHDLNSQHEAIMQLHEKQTQDLKSVKDEISGQIDTVRQN